MPFLSLILSVVENAWRLAPFVRFLFPLLLGIVSHIEFGISFNGYYFLLQISILAVYSTILFVNKKSHQPIFPTFLGVLAYLFLFFFGNFLVDFKNIKNDNKFLGNNLNGSAYTGYIDSELNNSVKTKKCVLVVEKVLVEGKWREASGKVLVYLDTNFALINKLKYGDELLINGFPQETKPPSNPGEFNYKKYLSNTQIFHRDYLNGNKALKIGDSKGNSLLAISIKARDFSGDLIRKFVHSDRESAILAALVVGVRSDLDDEILQAYSSAGAMHVLSVSGLHVALVFQLLTWILGFLQFGKIGKWIYYGLSLILIWGYAFLTGMCPSVMRSVVMFTVILIGQAFNRNSNTFNSIAFSGFLLLIYNPWMIMDVGFQLSYLAVLGIVYLQPKIYTWLEFKSNVADWVWQITAVSLAAQFVTFPLGILYFHQFPTYFLISNLVVIPASTIMLYGGIGLFLAAFIPYFSGWYGFALEKFTWMVNEFLVLNQKLPGAVWGGIYIEVWECWLIFGWMIILFLLFERKRFYYLVILSMLTLLTSFQFIHRQIVTNSQNQVFVYQIPKQTAIEFVTGSNSTLVTNLKPKEDKSKIRFHIQNNEIRMGLKNVKFESLDFEERSTPLSKSKDYQVFIKDEETWIVLEKYPKSFSEILEKSNPSKVLFISNSLYGLLKSNIKLKVGPIYIADGSNSNFIVLKAKEVFPEIYFTSINGCWKETE